MRTTNDQVQEYFDRHAGRYDRQMTAAERLLLGQHRQWAVAQATGRVLEIGVGTGLNLGLYSGGADVVGVELAPAMAARAQARAASAQVLAQACVLVGDAHALPFPAAAFDTVLSTYTLCSIPDPGLAMREAARVLRAGGRLVLAEHGASDLAWLRRLQRAAEPLFQRFHAEHVTREPDQYVRAAAFSDVTVTRGGRGGLVYRITARA